MSEQTDKMLEQINSLEATASRLIRQAYVTDPHVQLTKIVLPTQFTQFELAKYCEEHNFDEIRYNLGTRQFFGVRLIEDQPD